MTGDYNKHGGLTLIPLDGFGEIAEQLKGLIEEKSARDGGKETPVDIASIDFNEFPNGEPDPHLDKRHIGGHDCVILTTGPGTNEMIMRLLWALNFTSARRASRIAVVSGYGPLLRSDKDEFGKRLTTPPMLFKMLKAASMHPNGMDCLLDRVICADPHSPQSTMAGGSGFLTPIILSRRLLKPIVTEALAINPRICLAFPDDSADSRFGDAIADVERTMGITLHKVRGIKRRDRRTGKSKLVAVDGDLHMLEDALVIMLDDEIATGGSVVHMAEMLTGKYRATKAWAGVTHGVLCKEAPHLFMAEDSPVERIVMMDTIPTHDRPELIPMIESGRLQIHTWIPDMAWVILHHHWDMNIREMR